MTQETTAPQEEIIATTKTTSSPTGAKRTFSELQASYTIHDYIDEDEENDEEYREEVEEDTESSSEESEESDAEDVEEQTEAVAEEEEDITVEELTEIVKDAGLDGLSESDLKTKVLRGGKKIVNVYTSEEINAKAQELLAATEAKTVA